MRYTLFGKTGLRVSELCLGAMTFGGEGWGASRESCARIVDSFEEAGGNFVDTASNYTGGTSEEVVGELLEGRRDRFVLATKYTLQTEPKDPNAVGNHRKNLVRSLERSLRRLRTDHIDVLWVHARDTLTPVEEVMRALDDQVRAGKVLYVGVSDWPAWEAVRATTIAELRGWSPFVGLQIEYSLLERTVERELLPMARGLDLAVTAWSPLAGGRLTGKYLAGADHPDAADGRLVKMGRGASDERTDAVVSELVSVAEQLGTSPARVALAWLRSRPGLVIPIVGATKVEQLEDNLASVELELDADVRERLDRVSAVELGFPHDFLRGEPMPKTIIYGDRWREVDDRRSTVRRVPADDPALLER